MGQIFLGVLITILCLLLFKIVFTSQKQHSWFNNLKPNDKVVVRIFSENCECLNEAIVKSESDGFFITAELVDKKKCEDCAELKGKNSKGENTCWYKVVMFNKDNVYDNDKS